jgi:hypothetical protein
MEELHHRQDVAQCYNMVVYTVLDAVLLPCVQSNTDQAW